MNRTKKVITALGIAYAAMLLISLFLVPFFFLALLFPIIIPVTAVAITTIFVLDWKKAQPWKWLAIILAIVIAIYAGVAFSDSDLDLPIGGYWPVVVVILFVAIAVTVYLVVRSSGKRQGGKQ